MRSITFDGILAERIRYFDHQLEAVFKIIDILQMEEDEDIKNANGRFFRDLTKIEKNLLNYGLKGKIGR